MQEAKNPAYAVAEPSTRTAEFEQVHGTDVPMGTARRGTAVLLLSDRENRTTHTGMEKVAESDQMLSVSPVWSIDQQWGENGEGRVPLLEGDGTQLIDQMMEDGQPLYEEPGWRLMHTPNGYALWDNDGNLCFEEVDEDQLALMMWSVPRKVPVTAAQMDSMIEQNQQL